MATRKAKPERWSRKGRCPSCDVGTGSKHREKCTFRYGKSSGRKLRVRSEEDVKNLYYLDEMIKDMHKCGVLDRRGEKYITFLHDWYKELYEKVGHTDRERAAYIEKNFGGMDEGWIEDNFLSPEERDLFLDYDL